MSNAVVESFRQQFPAVNASDDDITELLYDRAPDHPKLQDPGFQSDIRRIRVSRGVSDAARVFGRSVIAPFASIPESVAIVGNELANRTGLSLGAPDELQDWSLYRLGQGMRNVIGPPSSRADESFLTSTLPGAFGSALGFVGGGVAGRVAKIPSMLSVGGLGAAAQATQGYEEAATAGADEDTRFKAFLLNAGVGASEILPMAGLVNRLTRATGGAFKSRLLMNAVRGGVEEAIQETIQQTASNDIARALYDPERPLFEDVPEGAAAGGIVGFTLSALVSKIAGRGARVRKDAGPAGEAGVEVSPDTGDEGPRSLGGVAPAAPVLPPDEAVVSAALGTMQSAPPVGTSSVLRRELAGLLAPSASGTIQPVPEEQALPGAAAIADSELMARMEVEAGQRREATAQALAADAKAAQDQATLDRARAFNTMRLEGTPGLQRASLPMPASTQLRDLPPDLLPPPPIAPPVVPTPVAPEPTEPVIKPHPIVAEIDFTDPRTTAEEGDLEVMEGLDVDTLELNRQVQRRDYVPSFFEEMPGRDESTGEVPFSQELGQVLTNRFSPGQQDSKTLTHRATVFENQNDGKVVILGTWKKGKSTYLVSRLTGTGDGISLEKFLGQKSKSGGQLWVPQATIRLTNPKKSHAAALKDMREFNARVANTARAEIALLRRAVGDMESKLEKVIHPEDSVETKLYTAIVEALPKDAATGAVSAGLRIDEVTAAVLRALYDKATLRPIPGREAEGRYAMLQVLKQFVNDKEFAGRPNVEQIRLVVERIGQRIYEAYANGAFQSEFGGIQALANSLGATGLGSDSGFPVIRLRSKEAGTGWGGPSNAAVSRAFNATIKALAGQNVDLAILTGKLEELLGFYAQTPNGQRLIAIAVADQNAPTVQEFTSLLHEAVHPVFQDLSPAIKARLHAAISSMGTPQFRSRIAANVQNRGLAESEEQLAEGAARALVEQGFNPDEARSFWDRLWRYVKDLYLQLALAVQEATLGYPSPNLANQFMQNRARAFLAGDSFGMTAVSSVGGGRPRAETIAGNLDKAHGNGFLNAVFNPETGAMEYPDVLVNSLESLGFYIRYKMLGGVTDPITPAEGRYAEFDSAKQVAAASEVQAWINTAWDQFNSRGLNRTTTGQPIYQDAEAFRKEFLNIFSYSKAPQELVAGINQELQRIGRPPLPPDFNIRDLQTEAFRGQAASIALKDFQNVQTEFSQRRNENDAAVKSGVVKIAKTGKQIALLRSQYTDAELMTQEVIDGVTLQFEAIEDDFKQTALASARGGELAQIIAQIDRNMDTPLAAARQYEPVINALFRRIAAGPGRFTTLMEAIARLDAPWQEMPTREMVEIITPTMEGFPEFRQIEDAQEKRALTAIVIAFAKRNQSVMDYLLLRRTLATEERTIVNEALREATRDKTTAMADAQMLVKALPRLGATAARLLKALNETLAYNLELKANATRMETFIQFHDEHLVPDFSTRMSALQQMIGAQLGSWEPIDGAKFPSPRSPDMTEQQVAEIPRDQWVTLRLNKDGTTPPEIKQHMKTLGEWLDRRAQLSPDNLGATWRNLKRVASELSLVDVSREYQDRSLTWLEKTGASITDKLDATGMSIAREISRRIRDLNSKILSHREKVKELGDKWATDLGAARVALDAGANQRLDTNEFLRAWYVPALKYINERQDLIEAFPQPGQATTRAISEAKKFFLSNPATAQAIKDRPEFWPAMEKLLRRTEETSSYFNTLRKEFKLPILDNMLGFFREAIGAALFHVPQKMDPIMDALWNTMTQAGWAKEVINSRRDADKLAAGYAAQHQADPAALSEALAPLFGADKVWSFFVKEIAYRGRPAFYGPKRVDGTWPSARRQFVMQAYDQAGGDVVRFAEILHALEGGQSNVSEFVGETLSTLHSFFSMIHNVKQKQAQKKPNSIAGVEHFLMDARISEELPAGFMQYATFNMFDTMGLLVGMAEHSAYGRDLTAVHSLFESAQAELKLEVTAYDVIYRNARATGLASGKSLRAEMETLAGSKENLVRLERASKTAAAMESLLAEFTAGIEKHSGFLVDFHPVADVLRTMPYAALQGVGTALTDLISSTEPLRKMGFSSQALRMIRKTGEGLGVFNFGSLMQAFNVQIGQASENIQLYNRMGMRDSDTQLSFRQKLLGIMQSTALPADAGIGARVGRGLVVGARGIRALFDSGIRGGTSAEDARFPTLKLHAPFAQFQGTFRPATTLSVIDGFSNAVLRAVEYFDQHPEAFNNLAFEFDANTLGYKNRFFLLNDAFAFDYFKNALNENGMSLETVARAALMRRKNDRNAAHTPLFTDEQYQRLANIAVTEIMLDGNNQSRPSWMINNPVLAMGATFLGWSLQQLMAVPKAFKEPDGTRSYRAYMKGLVAYSAIIPIGLAWSFLRDEYDERVLGKKANVLGFGESEGYMVVLDRLSRAGTLGIGGDALNSMLNQDTAREFSLDSRVFFASSLFSVGRTMGTWVRQDGDATWSTVGRPLFSALGGSGYLQNMDGIINMLGLQKTPGLTGEARFVSRINLLNHLRAAGRGMDLDVRTGKAAQSLSNPIKPWIGEMVLAAYADDVTGFFEAYRLALMAARGEKKEDPEKYVKDTYTAYHPMTVVFRVKPTEFEFMKMLGTMSPDGRQDVMEGMRLFNQFGERIGMTPSLGKKEQVARPFSLQEARRRSL